MAPSAIRFCSPILAAASDRRQPGQLLVEFQRRPPGAIFIPRKGAPIKDN